MPPVPTSCAPYLEGSSAPSATRPAPACDATGLANATGEPNALTRDRALAALEGCGTWPAGVIRALRAELAPTECGDSLVADRLSAEGATEDRALDREVAEPLFALALAGRLRRLASTPPAPPDVHDKPALEAYFQDSLFPWIQEQSAAIHQLAERGARLRGYARGVVAVEAGMADMRFVEIARGAPIPTEMRDDLELRTVYYATLDEALEPRKRRGRDAALAGLTELAKVGVLDDERLTAARSLLSRVYGGRRVDALDRLLLPALPSGSPPPDAAARTDAALGLAEHLPTFYTQWLLPEVPQETSEALLRAHLRRGVPRALRLDLSSRPIDDATALLLARAHVELGRVYFRAEDFAEAHRLLEGRRGAEIEFLRALALALMAGPKDAADMIARGPRFADALGNLEALDAIAAGSGPFAGLAGYDAAYLRELVAPAENAEYWQALTKRYEAAATKLTGPAKVEALGRAAAARATSRAISDSRRPAQ